MNNVRYEEIKEKLKQMQGDKITISIFQNKFNIGYGVASSIIEKLLQNNVIKQETINNVDYYVIL